MFRTLGIVFALCGSISPVGAQTVCATIGQTCVNAASVKQVFEVARGATDGQNRVFQISQNPATDYPLRVFRNGLELSPGTDFTFQSMYVTLTPRVIESAGDIIQVSYMIPVLEGQPATTNEPSLQTRGAIVDLLDRYLDRALKQELASAAPTSGQPAPVSTNLLSGAQNSNPLPKADARQASVPAVVPQHNTVRNYASLRMLSAVLAQPVNRNEEGKKREFQRNEATVAQGIDGLGDDPATGLFDNLLTDVRDRSGKKIAIASKGGRGAKSNSVPIRSSPPSLQMLQRSLQ